MVAKKSKEEIKKAVRTHYGHAITHGSGCRCGQPEAGENSGKHGGDCCSHRPVELVDSTEGVVSFGCGSPLISIDLKEGDVVLDLGCGAGLDMIMAAKQVGPSGKVIGLDITPEMVDTCRRNLAESGLQNTDVRLGEMEKMPADDGEADWIISNCVINLSPEKDKVFAEAFRVLKPGGRMMISDIVTMGLPDKIREDMRAWVECVAGALEEDEFHRLVREAGFEQVKTVEKQVYGESSTGVLTDSSCSCECGCESQEDTDTNSYAGKIASIRLYARKPD